MGPRSGGDGSINMGKACHIYSAAPGGPRGRGGKDENFIRSAANGLWCCAYHGDLIDKDKGDGYSAATLFSWKKLAEARIKKLMDHVPSPLGWVESVGFNEFFGRDYPPQINLSRNTLLWGENGSGKTVLMELAATVTNSRYAWRFLEPADAASGKKIRAAGVKGTVSYSTVDVPDKVVHIEVCGDEIARAENGVVCLLPPGDIEIIHLRAQDLELHSRDVDHEQMLMRALNVDKSALLALTRISEKPLLPGRSRLRFTKKYDDEEEAIYELEFQILGRDFYVPFSRLAGSEQVRLVIDLLIVKAREVAKQRLTLLLIDSSIAGLDGANFKRLLTALAMEDFQSVVVVSNIVEEDILERDSTGKMKLAQLDYLEPWRLALLPSIAERPVRAENET